MKSRSLLLLLFTFLFVLVPFLFWRATWFGRALNDQEIDQYLSADKPRLVQQGLAQVAERIISGKITPSSILRWYPRVVALAGHPHAELRSTVAWVMGQDNSSRIFHEALVQLLEDPEVLIRRNAALSLVRFDDTKGKPEILSMLGTFTVNSPEKGIVTFPLSVEDQVNPGVLIARLDTGTQKTVEIRSPLPGRIERLLVANGRRVGAQDPILLLSPSPEQVWEALRALVLIGSPEDIPRISGFLASETKSEESSDKIRQQANLTLQAIRSKYKERASF